MMNVKDIERRCSKGYSNEADWTRDANWLINEVKRLREGIDKAIVDIAKENISDATKIQKNLVDLLYNQ